MTEPIGGVLVYIHTYPEGGSIKRIDSQKAHGELFPMNLAPSKHPWWTGVLLLLASTGLVPPRLRKI